MLKYVGKGEWFKKGCEAVLVDDYRPGMEAGLFRGPRVCDNPDAEAKPMGAEYENEEVCGFDEFDVIEA